MLEWLLIIVNLLFYKLLNFEFCGCVYNKMKGINYEKIGFCGFNCFIYCLFCFLVELN